MNNTKNLKVALIGFGGIARTHNAAYKALIAEGCPISVVAVCEKNIEQFKASIAINIGGGDGELPDNVHIYTDVDDLIKNEDFDMADICLPTFLHKAFTIKLLEAGKHVLCEKPMALSSSDCEEMLAAAKENDCALMIGQCLRFDSFYFYLKEQIESEKFGKLRHLYLYRLSVYPRWGTSFANSEKTGGCILDTHIHDIDIARFLMGEPKDASALYFDNEPYTQIVNSRLIYDRATVVADCCWDESREKSFEAGFRASFEGANIIFNGEKMTVYPSGKEPYCPEIEKKDYFAEEIRAFATAILGGKTSVEQNSAESAYLSIKLIETLKNSAKENEK